MTDLNQIVENSITYNGPSSSYTQTSQLMKAQGSHKLQEVISACRGCALIKDMFLSMFQPPCMCFSYQLSHAREMGGAGCNTC